MIPDNIFPAGVWTDVYAATGIAPGTKIVIQVKGPSAAVVWEGTVSPGVNAWDGITCPPGDAAIVNQVGVTGCWIKSGAQITCNVQVSTDD